MSLIEAALRRAQDGPSQPSNAGRSPKTSPPRPPIAPRHLWNVSPTLWWLGSAFVLVIGLLASEARWPLRAPEVPTSPTSTAHSSSSLHRKLKESELQLSGIVKGTGESLAIINGTVVRPGDLIEGATVTEVNPTSVRLRRHAKDIILQQAR